MLALPLAYWVLCQLCKFLLLVCSVYLGGLPDQYWLRSPPLAYWFLCQLCKFLLLVCSVYKCGLSVLPLALP